MHMVTVILGPKGQGQGHTDKMIGLCLRYVNTGQVSTGIVCFV